MVKDSTNNSEDNSSQGDEYISEEGYQSLKDELENLKDKKRLEIARKLEYAKSLGDLSENAEYSDAKEEHMVNETKIAQLEEFLSRVKIIEKSKIINEVSLGSVIIVSSKTGLEKYSIVGTHEVSVSDGKVSNESPFGKAFIGKKKGERVKVRGPKEEIEYLIIEIT